MNQHDTFLTQDLVAFALGEADESMSTRIAAAAKANVAVQHKLSRIQLMIQSMRAGVFEPAPAEFKKAAVALFRRSSSATLSDWIAGLAHSTMSLVFDSRDTPQLAGFRGQSDSRHITFADGATEIDLLVEGDGDVRIVRGQVTGFNAERVAALGRGGTILDTVTVDESGTFILRMNAEARDLWVKGSERVFHIENVLSQ